MNKMKKPAGNVIPFANRYNNISPSDLHDIMEDLYDMGYLSELGKEFYKAFWELFIKKKYQR